MTVDAFSHFDAYATTCRAFIDYLHDRGIRVGAWHVGTDDWVRDYPTRYAT